MLLQAELLWVSSQEGISAKTDPRILLDFCMPCIQKVHKV